MHLFGFYSLPETFQSFLFSHYISVYKGSMHLVHLIVHLQSQGSTSRIPWLGFFGGEGSHDILSICIMLSEMLLICQSVCSDSKPCKIKESVSFLSVLFFKAVALDKASAIGVWNSFVMMARCDINGTLLGQTLLGQTQLNFLNLK